MSTPKKLNEQEELFTVNGFTVRANSTYVIKNKPDLTAPTGFQKEGSTKLPSDNVSESFQCRYVRRANSKDGVWDTGFFEYSPCYEGKESLEVKEIIKNLTKNLVKPYCLAIGDDEAISHKDDSKWINRNFIVYAEQVLNTIDPIDRMALYFALRAYQVTPKGEEGNPIYRDSSYVIVDTTKNLKLKDERASTKFKAMGVFYALLENDKPKLFAILKYLDLNFSTSTPDETLMGMFDEWLNTGEGHNRMGDFNRVYEEADSDAGYDKLQVYTTLKNTWKKNGSKITRTPQGKFFYMDTEIGADLKQAAENISKSNSLIHVKKELLLTDD